MNGLLSAFAGVLTGPNADRKDFANLKLSAEEIARIAADLKSKGMLHGSEELMNGVENKAIETAKLAGEENVLAFDTAQEITNGCMECHSGTIYRANNSGLSLKQLRR
jgi:hypothetical protein